MVEEIVYTSAEKGLKQGSRGFCTVVSTAGMSLALAERLESMSGYRHAFPLHDPQASLNPVCFAHVTTRLAGKSLHVISRVADAGQDYTGRSNKLAHHLVIDNVASLTPGPARLMAEPGVIVERWDGNVRNVPPRELRCAPLPVSIPLVAWHSLTGDEGWAGAVAEQLLQNPAPVSIIFNPGTETLTLVREVLDLIPAAQRWNVTFSTYFTRLLAGTECQLRFVLNETPEATSLRNDARARVIDLTNPLPAATGGTLVTMARKRQLTPQEPIASPQAPAAVRTRTPAEIPAKDTAAEIFLPKLKPSPSPLETPDKPQPPRDVPPPVRERSGKGLWIGLTLVLAVVTVTGVLIFLRPAKNNNPYADLVNRTMPQDERQKAAELEVQRAKKQAEKQRQDLEDQNEREKQAAELVKKKNADDAKTVAAQAEAAKQVEHEKKKAEALRVQVEREARLAQEGPFYFLKTEKNWHDYHGQWVFELPVPPDAISKVEDATLPGPRFRARKSPVDLELLDSADELFDRSPCQLELRRNDPNIDVWTVVASHGQTDLGKIAEYSVQPLPLENRTEDGQDCEIHFRWLKDSVRENLAAHLLRWWPLRVTILDRSCVLLQRRPFRPSVAPSWKDLTASKNFPFQKGPELEVVPWGTDGRLIFLVQIRNGKDSQNFQIAMGRGQTKSSPAKKPLSASDAKSRSAIKYFDLQAPILFKDTPPAISPHLRGYGEMSVTARHSSTDGFSFQPNVEILLRMPSESFMSELIGGDGRKYLRDAQKSPELLREFNPNLTKPELDKLRRERDAILSDPNEWRRVSLEPLPTVEKMVGNKVSELISETVETVRPYVSKFPMVDEKNVTDSENQIRRAVHGFIPKMQELQKEISDCTTLFREDYFNIKTQIDGIIKEGAESIVECRLEGIVGTPGAENCKEVRIMFLETSPANSTP